MSPVRLNLKKRSSQSGLTIGEVVVFILIAAISYLTLMKVFVYANEKATESEARTVMTNLALNRMEIIRSKWYDEKATPNWSSTLGPDAGETSEAQYDDVDDFKGMVETSMDGYTGYTRTTRVFYVDREGNVADSTGSITHLKRIIVKVSNPVFSPVEITSLVSSRFGVQHF